MKFHVPALTVFLLATLTALPSSAQSMKAGLWEINSKMISDNPEMAAGMAKMKEQMAAMPPEQRKMMEDMMAKRGVQMPGMNGDGGIVTKMCMTKEMAARNEVPVQHDAHNDCTSTRTPGAGKTMKIAFTCTKPPSSGEGELSFSDASYAMKMKMSSNRKGKPETMTMDVAGKWLGSDCGDIKPFALPTAK
jgi:hypothetical protein